MAAGRWTRFVFANNKWLVRRLTRSCDHNFRQQCGNRCMRTWKHTVGFNDPDMAETEFHKALLQIYTTLGDDR